MHRLLGFTIVIAVGVFIFLGVHRVRPDLVEVKKFGVLNVGEKLPVGHGPGDTTVWAPPYQEVPHAKFFVYVVTKDIGCVYESCGPEGALVETMGGYLEGINIFQGEFAVPWGLEEHAKKRTHQSVTVIGDQDARIVGIYPDTDMDDLLPILRRHPDVVSFSELEGVREFGPLKVGEVAPRKPGDPSGYAGIEDSYRYKQIPQGKKFYVYVFQKELLGKEFCSFWKCLGPGYFDSVDEFGGWFSSDGQPDTARAFGLDPTQLARGEISLVVLTDSDAKIVAIYPGKTMYQILGILMQYPKLADTDSLKDEWRRARYFFHTCSFLAKLDTCYIIYRWIKPILI